MSSYQCYHAFTSRRYRFCTFVLMPLILILLQGLLIAWRETKVFLTVSGIITAYFTVTDIWVFGASCTRLDFRVESLKSSTKGMALLRKSLIADCLVRSAITAAVLGLPAIADILYQKIYARQAFSAEEFLADTLFAILTSCAATALCLLICRYLSQAALILMIANIGMALVVMGLSFSNGGISQIAATAIAAAASIGFNALTVKKVLRHVRRSYYDQTDKI